MAKSSDFPEFIDRYRVKGRLGKGGQGEVYLAHDPNLDIEVALKVLASDNPDFVERFKIDARVLARLNAPNIVRIFDFNPTYPYLVMEYCGDGDLNDLIKCRRPMTLRRIVELTLQICDALIVAHEQPEPILHRDLKPGNVLFDKNAAKVTDFGLAKVLGDQTSGLTMSRGMMGTAAYASPEQLQDASKVDNRTDLWAVGVVLYELMTFHGPFESEDDDNVFQTAMRVVQADPIDPRYALPRPIFEVIERSLNKQREQRFASAREMKQALNAALGVLPEAEQNALFPPEQALTDLDRLARQVADTVDAGEMEAAAEHLREMKQISRDASVTRYWTRRLKSVAGDQVPVSGSTEAPTAAMPTSGSLVSIDKLTSGYRYADARRKCGELLVADPNNTLVHDKLQQITSEERELNQAIEAAREETNRANAANDLARAVEIWSALDAKYEKHPDITAELATAKRSRHEGRRDAERQRVKTDATALESTGDLAGALGVLDEYLKSFPDDQSLAPMREKIRSAHASRTREERVRALREKARAGTGEAPEAALASWQAVLDELPTDEEAHRETEKIRQAMVARSLARDVNEAETQAAPFLASYDYVSALAIWRDLQKRHPGDAGIADRIGRLEKAEAEYRKKTLTESLETQADELQAANDGGRYDACPGLADQVTALVRDARIALRGDVDALTAALEQIAGGRETAEGELTKRLDGLRLDLLRRLQDAGELLPGDPATKAEKALKTTTAGVTRALCEGGVLETTGNPLRSLDTARGAIESAIQGVATEREAETKKARERSDAAFKAAERAMKRLVASPAGGGAGASGLVDQLEALREKSGSHSARVLEQVVVASTELAHRAETTRVRGEWDRLRRVRAALVEASNLVSDGASGRLEPLAAKCLDSTNPDSKLTAQQQDKALAELIAEIETQRAALDEVRSGAARVWQQAVERSNALDDNVSEDLLGRIDASRRAGESLSGQELDREARRLAALVSRAQVESAWSAQAGTFHGLEGSADERTAVPADVQDLVAEYRGAVARGDGAKMKQLGKRIASDSGSSGSESLEVPRIDGKMRKINTRLLPEALEAYDRDLAAYERAAGGRGDSTEAAVAAARSYRTLVQPPPAWPRFAAAALLLVIVTSVVVVAMPKSGPQTVRLVSPSGTVRLVDVQRGGSSVSAVAGSSIDPTGLTIELESGEYEAITEHGATVRFRVPGDETVFVPSAPADHTNELADRLGLRELLSGDD